MHSTRNFRPFLFVSGGLIFFDQISKYIIRQGGGFYICNEGVSFGFRLPGPIFWFLGLILIMFILGWMIRLPGEERSLSIPMKSKGLFLLIILSGALSNMIDRAAFGCVVDFIDLKVWPVFNLADMMIFLGALGMLVKWRKI